MNNLNNKSDNMNKKINELSYFNASNLVNNNNNDVSEVLRFGNNSNNIKKSLVDIQKDKQNSINNKINNYYTSSNIISHRMINNNEINNNNNNNDKYNQINEYDNIKRKNLNHSFYYTPGKMSNSGFSDPNIYNNILYPLQSRQTENNIYTREFTTNRINKLSTKNDFGDNLDNTINYFRGGIDTRSNNKKTFNN